MVDFAGWRMPVQYEGIRQEHMAVREKVGIFDVSHMGQIRTSGPEAAKLLQRLLSSDVEKLQIGAAQYGLICREDGGIIDDLFTYRLGPDEFLTVTNAANHGKDLAWFRRHRSGFDATVTDAAIDYAMIAVQGPGAAFALQALSSSPLPEHLHCAAARVAATQMLVCRTGYTGEDGFELLIDPAGAVQVWHALVEQGAVPCGLGARDTLRLEVCFHLYGNDMDEQRTPIEAGLGWCCKEATGFVGAPAIAAAREHGTAEQLVPFVMSDSGIARHGHPVVGGGEVTSGTYSPSLELGIGMAYLPSDRARPGDEFEIDVRGQLRRATVATRPLYARKET